MGFERLASSNFNQCKHQLYPECQVLQSHVNVKPDSISWAVYKPILLPLHWQDAVKEQLDNDVHLRVLEKVPIGETDESQRRTVDISPLKAYCERENNNVKPLIQQAKAVPLSSSLPLLERLVFGPHPRRGPSLHNIYYSIQISNGTSKFLPVEMVMRADFT